MGELKGGGGEEATQIEKKKKKRREMERSIGRLTTQHKCQTNIDTAGYKTTSICCYSGSNEKGARLSVCARELEKDVGREGG